MKETVYVVGPKSVFDPEFADFQAGTGWYYENNFSNWGTIRYSLDGQLVLLEELRDKFKPEHLDLPDVIEMTQDECKQYLIDNKANWQSEDDLI